MGLFKLLLENPLAFFVIAIPLLYAIVLHEVAHGWVAYRMGDSTAKNLGRLTLNPLKHLDPIGTLMLFVVGFGWAKPVPVNFGRLKEGRKGMILVASAGIITNMIMAFLALLIMQMLSLSQFKMPGVMLYYVAQINIILAAFNLIPLPPLDGSKILLGFAPADIRNLILRIEPYGFFVIIALLYFGLLTPVINFFRQALLAVIGLLI